MPASQIGTIKVAGSVLCGIAPRGRVSVTEWPVPGKYRLDGYLAGQYRWTSLAAIATTECAAAE